MNEKMIADIPISKRNIGFVPQNFRLFPHLSVFDNISYGLKIRKMKIDTIKTRVKNLIEMVKIDNLENRKPKELSWGQQQRVALARALVIRPNMLLLDEPLSSVDWITRWDITHEIKKIQEKLRITTIYVTHDIDEAFELGHRITIMNAGKLEQCDTPENLIKNPINSFVSKYVYQGKELKRRKIINEGN
jgi:ABC-type Fe3+/spermidine/putrescine transport system ATPase subunit